MHVDRCVCAHLPKLDLKTRVVLVIHYRERRRPTGTGPLAAAALLHSELYVHGLRDAPLDLEHLHHGGRRVLVLFPAENARVLSPALIAADDRPITLVVPDGNWRQASRIPKRVPGLLAAECVTLPPGPPTRWGVRKEVRADGLATFEAMARALGILESASVQHELECFFDRLAAATLGQNSRRE